MAKSHKDEQPAERAIRFMVETREAWPELNLYQRFEQIIALVLTGLMSVVIVVAVWNLVVGVVGVLGTGLIDPANAEVFQQIFGMFMIVLIALEFNHSMVDVLERRRSIVQLRTVVLIALLAVLRKFIVVEVGAPETGLILSLSAAALALGALFWVVQQQDSRRRRGQASAPGTDTAKEPKS